MRRLGRHLGAQVAALVDGQLPDEETERAWDHVLRCGTCRSALERETWVKNRLQLMSPTDPPPGLTGALSGLGGDAAVEDSVVSAWATVGELEQRHRARRTGLAVVGAGSASLAIIGLGAFGGLLETTPPTGNETSIGGTASRAPAPTAQPVDHLVPAERRLLASTRSSGPGRTDGRDLAARP